MPITLLLDDQDTPMQTVQLDLHTNYSRDVVLTYATITPTAVTLARLKPLEYTEEGRPEEQERISLSTSEVRALIDAFTAWEAAQEAKRQAELDRVAALLGDALDLAESVETELDELNIQVSEQEDSWEVNWYTVRVPALRWQRNVYIGGLKARVNEAISEIERHIQIFERHMQTPNYEQRFSEDVRAVHTEQVAAWRKVRPLAGQGVDDGSEVNSDDPALFA